MSKEFSYSDVAEHNTKRDLYLVVHEKVYDTSSFIDEHPGGQEVLFDVAGQDATEAFEDVGHSDEAREILEGLLVGKLKPGEGEPKPKETGKNAQNWNPKQDNSGMGVGLYAMILVGGAVAYFAYQYLQQSQQNKS